MNRSLSIYLDLLRLLASFAVVLSHSAVFVMPAMSKIFRIHGTEAVAIFFVLSGFVIGYVTTEKNESHWKTYAIARLSRMLSVVVIAIPMVLIVDKIGLSINPDFYEGKDWFNPNTGFFEFLRAISFTNEVWNMHSIFGSNEPYWSLGFEVPYYILFGLSFFLSGKIRIISLISWSIIFGLKIILYLPLWLMGLVVLRIVRSISDSRKIFGFFIFGGSIISYGLLKVAKSFFPDSMRFSIFRPVEGADYVVCLVYFLLVGVVISANIVGFRVLVGDKLKVPQKLEQAIRWLAGGSFTLYLLHMPLLVLIRAVWPKVAEHPLNGILGTLAVIAFCYLLAELGERRKQTARHAVEWLFGKAVHAPR